jgi:hypothetical protein
MNFSTLAYVVITVAALIFSGVLLFFTRDVGTHDFAITVAALAVGHWFGYSNQLTITAPKA